MQPLKLHHFHLLAALAGLVVHSASAQLDLSTLGTNYLETFDGIASGLPPGWWVCTNATATSPGDHANFNPASTSWSATSGQFANYASIVSNDGTNFTGSESSTVQGGCTNRAPGLRPTSSFGDPGAAFVLCLANTLGLTSLQLNLDFLMLKVNGYSTVWNLEYAVGNTPTNFTVKASYEDPAVFGATHANIAFGHALDNQSEKVWIRVAALAPSAGSGSRDTFGLDNFSLSWVTNAASQTYPPSILAPPRSRTNDAATAAGFSVEADGTSPLSYQWRKNGTDLADTNNISGATSTALTFSSVFKADEADYSVVITNSAGSITSSVARLTVIDPVIVTPPASRTNLAGDTAGFFARAAGTATLGYRWFHGGLEIPGTAADAIEISNVGPADAGDYVVVVTNACGTTTSSAAALSLLPTPTNRIVRWDFNDAASSPPAAPLPCEGVGTAALAGETTATFSTGSSADPGGTNSGWNTTDYPAQGASNLQAGVEFRVSTAGYQNILLTWEQRNTSRASKYARLQYSTDGTRFQNHNVIVMRETNSAFVFYADDLSAIPGVNDNPNFAFRIVTEVEDSATGSGSANYVPTFGSTYSVAGTIRFDLVNVFGNVAGAVPPEASHPLRIDLIDANAVLTWTNAALLLQSAPTATGLFTNVPGATSPYTNPVSGKKQFFRLSD